ncbi:MAG: 5'-nucleotidase, lipoprotein e(P4) family, partial [Bacteroidota bacterium]
MRKTCFVVGALLVVALATPTLSQDSAIRNINEQSVSATAWFQSSAEAQALFYQAYNVARWMLDHD